MDKYGRELDLILLLTDNANYTTQQLADRLGITRRNVYYYLDYLRDCGFNLIKSGTCYRLDRSSSFFRRLHENIALSEAEADYICRKLDFTDSKDYTAQSVRQKLTRTFNLPNRANPDLERRVNASITKLKEAMATRQMVMLHDYSSPHSHTVSDRIVEPYLFMNDLSRHPLPRNPLTPQQDVQAIEDGMGGDTGCAVGFRGPPQRDLHRHLHVLRRDAPPHRPPSWSALAQSPGGGISAVGELHLQRRRRQVALLRGRSVVPRHWSLRHRTLRRHRDIRLRGI